MSSPEGRPSQPRSPESVLEEPGVTEFIEARQVPKESRALIVELAQIPRDTLITSMHNFFSHNQGDRALPALKRSAELAPTEEQKRLFTLFHAFTEQNDWYASRHLVFVLEKRGWNP